MPLVPLPAEHPSGCWPLGYTLDNDKLPGILLARMDPTRPLYKRLRSEIACSSQCYNHYQLLTLTFRVPTGQPKRAHMKVVPDILFNMHRICRTDDFHCFPELTARGRLHYHILFRTYNLVTLKAFRGFWERKYGTTHMEPMEPTYHDFLCTLLYIRKDSRAMLTTLRAKKWSKVHHYILTQSSYRALPFDGYQPTPIHDVDLPTGYTTLDLTLHEPHTLSSPPGRPERSE